MTAKNGGRPWFDREPDASDPSPSRVRDAPEVVMAFASGEWASGPHAGESFLDLYAHDDAGRVLGYQTYTMEDVENLHAFLGTWLRYKGKPTPAMRAELAVITGVDVKPPKGAS